MKRMISVFIIFFGLIVSVQSAFSADESIKGTYRAILQHEQSGYYQNAIITLSSVNTGDGNLRISASVRILFGDVNSNEFLTYDYPDCPMNILTRQISLRDNNVGVSLIGYLKDGSFSGEWYSPTVGRVGAFSARKNGELPVPENSQLVRSVTGHYIGKITNTNPNSNLPETVTVSLVTTQDPTSIGKSIIVSGNMRLYFGDIGSTEYVETKFASTDFNFYSRYLTAKTVAYGITLKGGIGLNGLFQGEVFADGIGRVGTIEVQAQ
jgi:hypothetical protein